MPDQDYDLASPEKLNLILTIIPKNLQKSHLLDVFAYATLPLRFYLIRAIYQNPSSGV
ncbi:MAG: hypothetical protein ACTJLL_02830 [Anaplasma sp.]